MHIDTKKIDDYINSGVTILRNIISNYLIYCKQLKNTKYWQLLFWKLFGYNVSRFPTKILKIAKNISIKIIYIS